MGTATEKHIPSLRRALEALGYEELQFNTSYGVLVGIAARGPSGLSAVTSRTEEHPRGRGLTPPDWLDLVQDLMPLRR